MLRGPCVTDVSCSKCGCRMQGQRASASVPTCQQCRKASAVHGTTRRYERGCRCIECRAAIAAKMREYAARVKERDGQSPTQKIRPKRAKADPVCVDCGSDLRTAMTETPRCRPCRVIVQRKKLSAARRRARALADLAKAADGKPPRHTLVAGSCARCATSFVSFSRGVYCSTACRGKKSSSWIKLRKRLAIYERDDWTCQLCLEPVDRTLHYLDNWAASLDHIECRSWTSEPDHSPENLRLAHRWCNAVRGNESHYTVADLRYEKAA